MLNNLAMNPYMVRSGVENKIICHRCGVEGHKSSYCQEEKIPEGDLESILHQNPTTLYQNFNVTCFSCYQKGHYANACPIKIIMK